MSPSPLPLLLEVVEHEEYRQIEQTLDAEGKVADLRPIRGSETAFLHLRAPNGTLVRAQIPHDKLDVLLALMFPDDFAAAG